MISGLTEQVWQEVDEFIEAFELAWTADAVPEIKEFLPDTDHPQFRKTLLELVRVDLEFRWKHGCAKSLEEYRREFPELFDDVESLCQIGFEEFRVRRQAGELVAAKEYANRFGIRTDLWPMLSNATEAAASSATLAGPSIVRSVSDRQTNEELLSDATDFPEVGSDMLGFQLQSELGRGAFSRVYLARQGDLANRLVVLKVSAESFAEADKLAQLQHANIVPIYSLHRTRKRTVVCMPYFGSATLADVVRDMHGLDSLPPSGRVIVETLNACGERTVTDRQQSLAQPGTLHSISVSTNQTQRSESQKSAVSKETRIPYDGALKTLSGLTYVEAVLWIGARLADGLNHAHERGILHRDLKPANVLIADDGRPMLLDFNLSADLKQSAGVREMLVGGTLPYMAPEQIYAFQQRIHSGDARSDIFSLGVILFELLAGTNPFPNRHGALEDLLANMLHDRRKTPPRLRLLNPAASPAVEAVVRRCLEPDPARRYQTAGELHEDLERHLKQLPLRHTSEPSLRERTQKWTQRHARLTAVMSFVLIVGGVSLAIGAHRENKRVTAVEAEVAQLMEAGRQALDDHDVDVAHGRFLAAWMKVQAEPALVDHQPGVAGWLDHSRRAVIQKQWRLRTQPREFDQRRDEALVLSLVLPTSATQQGARQALLPVTVNETGKSVTPTMLGLANAASDNTARDALHAAMDLTVAGDPGWTRERELLTLVEADLTSLESNAERALQHLDETHEFSSRAFHQCRAKLLEQLGRDNEAKQAALMGDQFPSERSVEPFVDGMCLARRQKFDRALNEFETVLDVQPELFNARLFQAICFLKVNRPSEAKVALTSCIAQRPQFQWSYFFRSQASVALGDEKAARADLQAVLDMNPSETLRQLIALTLKSFP